MGEENLTQMENSSYKIYGNSRIMSVLKMASCTVCKYQTHGVYTTANIDTFVWICW